MKAKETNLTVTNEDADGVYGQSLHEIVPDLPLGAGFESQSMVHRMAVTGCLSRSQA